MGEATPTGGNGHQTPGVATTARNCVYLATKFRVTGRDSCLTRAGDMAVELGNGYAKRTGGQAGTGNARLWIWRLGFGPLWWDLEGAAVFVGWSTGGRLHPKLEVSRQGLLEARMVPASSALARGMLKLQRAAVGGWCCWTGAG